MQTLKTAVVVVLLLFVLYGGFVAINGSSDPLNPELEAMVGFDVDSPDISVAPGPVVPTTTASSGADPWAAFNAGPAAGSSGNAFSSSPSFPPPTNSSFPQIPPSLGEEAGDVKETAEANALPVPALPATLLPPTSPADLSATTPDVSAPSVSTPAASVAGLPSPFPSLPALPGAANSAPDFGIALPQDKPAEGTVEGTAPKADATANTTVSAPGRAYENAKENALAQAKRGQLREALATLSLFYNTKDITPEQRGDMLDILDALAREVVYSKQHYLDIAYYPVPKETIDQVAAKFEIPVEILARINNLTPGEPIAAGVSVKVVPGPFRAEVDVTKNELTVFLGELYAGRYPISVGKDKEVAAGDFKVVDKQRDRNYYSNGTPIAGNDPSNPYGGYWIDLGNELCIHGSSSQDADERGCISLSPTDASDLFGMLAHGSQVTIVR